jgi:hypothetical protein
MNNIIELNSNQLTDISGGVGFAHDAGTFLRLLWQVETRDYIGASSTWIN